MCHELKECICSSTSAPSLLSVFKDVATIIIAIANLALAYYVFIFNRQKAVKDSNDTAALNTRNIRLQWFKELVIQPHISTINNYYLRLNEIYGDILKTDNLTQEFLQAVNNSAKAELALFKKSFIEVLELIEPKLGRIVIENSEGLVDQITNSLFNDELKLNHPSVYEKQIGSLVRVSKNKLLATIYNYDGDKLS
jgi:ABC-type anion transport system duplicated permease subunit